MAARPTERGRPWSSGFRRTAWSRTGVRANPRAERVLPQVDRAEPTGRCNLTCGHCFASLSGADLPEEAFEAVLRGAVALGAIELTFNGGEPLLHPRCLDWIRAASDAGLRTLLFTNATTVTERIAGALSAAGVAKVTVSLDGFAAANDALRGAGAFHKAERGIRRLVAAGLPVHVTTMVHPGNRDEVEALHRHCREVLGVAGVRLSTIAQMGKAAGRPDLQLEPAQLRAVHQAESRKPSAATSFLPCLAGVDKLYVSAGGDVHACHLFEGVGVPLGSVPASRSSPSSRPIPRTSCLGGCSTAFARGALRLRQVRVAGRVRRRLPGPGVGDDGEQMGADPIACRSAASNQRVGWVANRGPTMKRLLLPISPSSPLSPRRAAVWAVPDSEEYARLAGENGQALVEEHRAQAGQGHHDGRVHGRAPPLRQCRAPPNRADAVDGRLGRDDGLGRERAGGMMGGSGSMMGGDMRRDVRLDDVRARPPRWRLVQRRSRARPRRDGPSLRRDELLAHGDERADVGAAATATARRNAVHLERRGRFTHFLA